MRENTYSTSSSTPAATASVSVVRSGSRIEAAPKVTISAIAMPVCRCVTECTISKVATMSSTTPATTWPYSGWCARRPCNSSSIDTTR